MPIVLIVGMPCVGKSTRADELKRGLKEKYQKNAHIISDNSIISSKHFNKNDVYRDFQKEKEVRGILKSEVLRLLDRESVVILDSTNHIKGYRYELYCGTKGHGTTQLLLECLCSHDEADLRNESRTEHDKYDKDVMTVLRNVYETPNGSNRWDSPLITLQSGDEIPWEKIYDYLFERKPPPPNQSTQCAPLSSSDFLHDLDKVTQDIVKEVLDAKRSGNNCTVLLSGGSIIDDCSPANPALMAKLRRQFLNYSKLHPPAAKSAPADLAELFVQFLNSTFCNMS